jgi:hypothetical protein
MWMSAGSYKEENACRPMRNAMWNPMQIEKVMATRGMINRYGQFFE